MNDNQIRHVSMCALFITAATFLAALVGSTVLLTRTAESMPFARFDPPFASVSVAEAGNARLPYRPMF